MNGVNMINKFLFNINNGKPISKKFYNKIINSEDIPQNIKIKIKKAYIKYGGSPEDLTKLPYYACNLSHIKKNCGTFGCVYGFYPDCQKTKISCPGICPQNINTIFKIIRGSVINDIRLSVEKFIKLCITLDIGESFLNGMTSFKKVLNRYTLFRKDDYYCYFLKLCEGDVNKLLKDGLASEKNSDETIVNFIQSIVKNILIMNDLCFIHGDIKFDNILYKRSDKYISNQEVEFYIHDFDSVVYFDKLKNIENNEPFPMFTPYCACPIYVYYRHYIKSKKNDGNLLDFITFMIDDEFKTLELFINGIIGANVGSDILFKYLCSKRDNLCAKIINGFLMEKIEILMESKKDEDIEFFNALFAKLNKLKHQNYFIYILIIILLYGEQGIRKLIQYSDLFSISMELLYQYHKSNNPLFLKLGNSYLTSYFYLPIQTEQIGGHVKLNLADNIEDIDESILKEKIEYPDIKGTCLVKYNNDSDIDLIPISNYIDFNEKA